MISGLENHGGGCLSTLSTILKDNWEWRGQIRRLALFELTKRSRGAALGWAWFFVKPAVYIFCFWFAIEVGLRAVHTDPNGPPFILWLSAGIVPWFFMQEMLGQGIDVMHRFPYLVNKIKFPLSAISTLYATATMIVQLMLQAVIVVIYLACGQPLDFYLLQIPFLLVIMYVFWIMFSILMSPLCAMSKDVKNLMGALSTPFFWLSGVIFNVKDIPIDAVQWILYFNPITFLVTGFRDAVFDKVWIWEDPIRCICFAIVFAVTCLCALFIYRRYNEEVADVL